MFVDVLLMLDQLVLELLLKVDPLVAKTRLRRRFHALFRGLNATFGLLRQISCFVRCGECLFDIAIHHALLAKSHNIESFLSIIINKKSLLL